MDSCPIFLVDSAGVKRPHQANLNQRLGTFLKLVNTLTGTVNTVISTGDNIYGPDYHNYTLRDLNIRPGIDIELMSSFTGGMITYTT